MSINQPKLVLVANASTDGGEIDHQLVLFIDRAIVPILAKRWAEESAASNPEHPVVKPQLPAAA